MSKINRRDFLYTAKSILYSLIFWGIAPFSIFGKSVDSGLLSNGKRKKKILILYASFHGSTAQIAEFMADLLNKGGTSASVKSIKDEVDFSSYHGIVMGAPIHRGKWMVEAIDFVDKYREQLDQQHFACFYTCMSKAKQPPSEDTIEDLAAYQAAITDLFPNLSHSHIGSFAGMVDFEKCNLLTKLVLWWIMNRNGLKGGDYRDWKAIGNWLSGIKNMWDLKIQI